MTEQTNQANRCPLCGIDNNCGNLVDAADCWCFHTVFPKEIFDRIPAEKRRKACICKSCVDSFTASGETSR